MRPIEAWKARQGFPTQSSSAKPADVSATGATDTTAAAAVHSPGMPQPVSSLTPTTAVQPTSPEQLWGPPPATQYAQQPAAPPQPSPPVVAAPVQQSAPAGAPPAPATLLTPQALAVLNPPDPTTGQPNPQVQAALEQLNSLPTGQAVLRLLLARGTSVAVVPNQQNPFGYNYYDKSSNRIVLTPETAAQYPAYVAAVLANETLHMLAPEDTSLQADVLSTLASARIMAESTGQPANTQADLQNGTGAGPFNLSTYYSRYAQGTAANWRPQQLESGSSLFSMAQQAGLLPAMGEEEVKALTRSIGANYFGMPS